MFEKKKPVICCGDLNVDHNPEDLANPQPNEGKHGYTNEEREGIDKIVSAGFVDTFRIFTKGAGNYSWWSHFANSRESNVGWRIDYFFVSKSIASKVKSASIYPEIYGSAHCTVEIEISIEFFTEANNKIIMSVTYSHIFCVCPLHVFYK